MQAAICEWRGYTNRAFVKLVDAPGEFDRAAVRNAALDAAGSFAAIRRNSDGSVEVVTDHSGSISIYYAFSGGRVLAGFSACDVATKSGRLELDPISVVDFVVNETVCYPHTLFRDVFVAPPGAISRLDSHGLRSETYFEPHEAEDRATLGEWGDRLRAAIQGSLWLGLEGRRRVKVLFSGGEDSRAVASLIPASHECTLVTFADADNREVRLARRAARVLGRPFLFVQRPEGFYRRNLCERAALVSGLFDVRHTHAWGEMGRPLSDADAIVGAYNSDSLVKSMCMRNRARTLGGLGPERLSSAAVSSTMLGEDPANYPAWIARDLALAAANRRGQHGARLRAIRPRTAANWDTLWPQGTHRSHYGHVLAAQGIGPLVVEPFLDSQVYRLAALMPDHCRIDRRVFRAAFNPVMGYSKWLPSSSGRIPALGGYLGRAVELAIKSGRAGTDYFSKRTLAFRGAKYPEQEAWTRDCFGFDIMASEHLNSAGKRALEQLLSVILANGLGSTTEIPEFVDAELKRLPMPERSRFIQAACLMSNRAGGHFMAQRSQ